MDKIEAAKIMDRMLDALAHLETELGVKIVGKGGSFNADSVLVKFEVARLNEDGKAQTPERTAFLTMSKLFGLDPKDLDREFTTPQGTYVITGLMPSRHKFPICAEGAKGRIIGKNFKFAEKTVKEALGK